MIKFSVSKNSGFEMQPFCIRGTHIPLNLSYGPGSSVKWHLLSTTIFSIRCIIHILNMDNMTSEKILTRKNKDMKSWSIVTRWQKLFPSSPSKYKQIHKQENKTNPQKKTWKVMWNGNSGHENIYLPNPTNCISKLFHLKIFDYLFIKSLISSESKTCKPPITVASSAMV